MTSLSLYTKLETLPAELKEQAKNFIDSLINKAKKNKGIQTEQKLTKRQFGSLKGKIHFYEED